MVCNMKITSQISLSHSQRNYAIYLRTTSEVLLYISLGHTRGVISKKLAQISVCCKSNPSAAMACQLAITGLGDGSLLSLGHLLLCSASNTETAKKLQS